MTGTEGHVRVIRREEGEPIDFRGAKLWRKVTREDTGERWAFGESINEPGFHNTPHTHTEPEGFYVLEGEYTFYTEGEPRRVGPNSFVFIPPDTRHGFIAGPQGGRLLCLWPAAFDGYFWAMRDAFQQHGEDPDVLGEVARKHGMKSLPVPSRREQ
jgi:quercetin dioxygenase-like cupin family protein